MQQFSTVFKTICNHFIQSTLSLKYNVFKISGHVTQKQTLIVQNLIHIIFGQHSAHVQAGSLSDSCIQYCQGEVSEATGHTLTDGGARP